MDIPFTSGFEDTTNNVGTMTIISANQQTLFLKSQPIIGGPRSRGKGRDEETREK